MEAGSGYGNGGTNGFNHNGSALGHHGGNLVDTSQININGKMQQGGFDVHYGSYGSSPEDQRLQFSGRYKAESLLLLFRVLTFALSLASIALMLTDTSRWLYFDAYRYVFAANLIVCVYSFVEIGFSFWYLVKGKMLMPEFAAYWFDYGHDQAFAYMIFSASSAATTIAHNLREGYLAMHVMSSCQDTNYFCTIAEISIGLSFGAFLFIALSSFISGYRLAKWLIIGP